MHTPKHLPLNDWPESDQEAFRLAYAPGDIFDDNRGPGAHLAAGTRRSIETAYRRWLGYLRRNQPHELLRPPEDRINPIRVRAYIEQFEDKVRPTSVASYIHGLKYAARLIAPQINWDWLNAIACRLAANAKPQDRFDRLIAPWHIFDLGIELMDDAGNQPTSPRKVRELRYRDGLLLALLSLWPIRRRAISALTLSRHIELEMNGATLLLYPEDTKARRHESFRLPDILVPYLRRYLKEMRPALTNRREHDGLWASYRGRPLSESRIYDIVRRRIAEKFGKQMNLHDVRRSAATFIAVDAPEKIGLIPSVLQHTTPEVGEKHYNLSRSITAGRRHASAITSIRTALELKLG